MTIRIEGFDQPQIDEATEDRIDRLVDSAKDIFKRHENFRAAWGDWFAEPERFDCTLFVLEELTEIAQALRTNTGKYARNNNGDHKATLDDLHKELADLFLMVHTLHSVWYPVDTESLARSMHVWNHGYEAGKFDELARETTTLARFGFSDINQRSLANECIAVMAYLLLWPEWDAAKECQAVLSKWERRAATRQILHMAEKYDLDIRLRVLESVA